MNDLNENHPTASLLVAIPFNLISDTAIKVKSCLQESEPKRKALQIFFPICIHQSIYTRHAHTVILKAFWLLSKCTTGEPK